MTHQITKPTLFENNIKQAVHYYHSLGFKTFPVIKDTKISRIKSRDTYTPDSCLTLWNDKGFNHNIGIYQDRHLICLDADNETTAKWLDMKMNGHNPAIVKTKHGTHYYGYVDFTVDPILDRTNIKFNQKDYQGEIKLHNSYALAPPSTTTRTAYGKNKHNRYKEITGWEYKLVSGDFSNLPTFNENFIYGLVGDLTKTTPNKKLSVKPTLNLIKSLNVVSSYPPVKPMRLDKMKFVNDKLFDLANNYEGLTYGHITYNSRSEVLLSVVRELGFVAMLPKNEVYDLVIDLYKNDAENRFEINWNKSEEYMLARDIVIDTELLRYNMPKMKHQNYNLIYEALLSWGVRHDRMKFYMSKTEIRRQTGISNNRSITSGIEYLVKQGLLSIKEQMIRDKDKNVIIKDDGTNLYRYIYEIIPSIKLENNVSNDYLIDTVSLTSKYCKHIQYYLHQQKVLGRSYDVLAQIVKNYNKDNTTKAVLSKLLNMSNRQQDIYLKNLYDKGLVIKSKDGRSVVYAPSENYAGILNKLTWDGIQETNDRIALETGRYDLAKKEYDLLLHFREKYGHDEGLQMIRQASGYYNNWDLLLVRKGLEELIILVEEGSTNNG